MSTQNRIPSYPRQRAYEHELMLAQRDLRLSYAHKNKDVPPDELAALPLTVAMEIVRNGFECHKGGERHAQPCTCSFDRT